MGTWGVGGAAPADTMPRSQPTGTSLNERAHPWRHTRCSSVLVDGRGCVCVVCRAHCTAVVQSNTSLTVCRHGGTGPSESPLQEPVAHYTAPKSLVMHESTTKASLRTSDCATDIPFTVPDPPIKCPEYGHAAQTAQGQEKSAPATQTTAHVCSALAA
jgi:hypothetical protein